MLPALVAPAALGGMSTIHRHRDPATGRDLAVKRIRGDVEMERFVREIRVLSELDDPAIVRYVGQGRDDDGTPYLVMEWLEGETLAQRLLRGPLSVGETITVARRVLGALHVAHAAGIIHRDLKPSNLFLVDGRVEGTKLIDFGVARVLGGARSQTLTRSGVALGTPAYMAPEQVRGSRLVDGRADLFALGSVLYECLAGWPAFSGTDEMVVMSEVLTGEPRALPVPPPPGLARLLGALLRKDLAARPANAAEVLALLDGIELESTTPEGSAAWFEVHTAAAAEAATRCDHDALLGILTEAGRPALDEPARRAQLGCLADGTLALFELGLGDLADALASRAVALARALRLPDDESAGLVAMVRAAQAASRRNLSAAIDETARAVKAFAAAGDTPRALVQRAALADLAADTGEFARARSEADTVLATAGAPAAALDRARLVAGKVAFAMKKLADARVQLRRVSGALPWLQGRALILLAQTALRTGHIVIAETEARAALATLADLPSARAEAQEVLGQVLARQRKPTSGAAAA